METVLLHVGLAVVATAVAQPLLSKFRHFQQTYLLTLFKGEDLCAIWQKSTNGHRHNGTIL